MNSTASSEEPQGLAVPAAAEPERQAAFVVGEVVDLARLLEQDEAGTLAALARHKGAIVDPALSAHGGVFADSPGDTMMLGFGTARDAVLCAAAIQQAMLSRDAATPAEPRIQLKLAVGATDADAGPAEAAALLEDCRPGGVCLSAAAEAAVRGMTPLRFEAGSAGRFHLRPEPSVAAPEMPGRPAPEQMTQAPVGPGTSLNDSYRIEGPLASGGMGEIFRGREIHTGGAVAIKLIRLEMSGNEAALSLFQKEAAVLKQIYHEAIVRYYAFSFDPVVRRHYLAMEFVDGTPLSDLIRRKPLSFEQATALRQRVAAALQVAHDYGIIHRDVSPDNIIVPAGDVSRAKIIDFGIARSTAVGAGTILGGGFAGKYNYVSPEQLGLVGGNVTAKSDIYSFGLVLAEALTGKPIDMGGSQAEVIDKRRSVPDLAKVDARLRPLLEAMLQPDPADRPASMSAVAAWIPEHAAPSGPTPTARPQPVAPVRPPRPLPPAGGPARGRTRWIIGGTAGVLLLFGGGLAAYLALPVPQPKPPETPALPSGPPAAPSAPAALPPVSPPQGEPPASEPPAPTTTTLPPAVEPPSGPAPLPSPSPSPAPATNAGRIAQAILGYDGGACFFARPVTIKADSAGIDGFASSGAAFDGLNRAVVQAAGFEPDITGHVVWSKQCAAVDFLRRVFDPAKAAPGLFLKSTNLAKGQALSGEIRGFGDRSVRLLQVQEDGTVRDLTASLKPRGDVLEFDMPLPHEGGGGPFPELLVALASPGPLAAIDKPTAADQLFPALERDAAAKGQRLSATAKLFLMKG